MDDVKLFRKIIADRDYQQARADEAVRQSDAWRLSASNWEALYRSEKLRADVTQENRIAELQKANAAYKDQAENDRQRLGEMEFKIRKLKSQRKWFFAAGLGAGLYGGYRIAQFRF